MLSAVSPLCCPSIYIIYKLLIYWLVFHGGFCSRPESPCFVQEDSGSASFSAHRLSSSWQPVCEGRVQETQRCISRGGEELYDRVGGNDTLTKSIYKNTLNAELIKIRSCTRITDPSSLKFGTILYSIGPFI